MSLDRFHDAQDHPVAGFAQALAEIEAGAKRRHWIWYVLPQIAGLGQSSVAARFAIADEAEAVAYLRDPVLRDRLVRIAWALARQLARGVALEDLMGSRIDALKAVSSLTLFGCVAERHPDLEGATELASVAEAALSAAARQGFPRCAHTERCLTPAAST